MQPSLFDHTPTKPTGKPPERAGTVFVLQDDGTKNLFPATQYGRVVSFTGRDMPMFNQDWIPALEGWLANYKPYRDWLLLVGDPVLIGVACAIIGQHWNNINLLKWDRQEKQYIPLRLFFEERR